MKLNELTIKEAREGLKKKQFSCLELVKSCLEQINKTNSKLNSFITVCEEEATEKAVEIDRGFRERKPLLGIPIALKDLYCTKGIKKTAGSKVLENYIPVYDATVVDKLKNAGAIIIGKTNCDAWAHGASGENSDFGPTRNPWNLERTPGGSSSGSAVAAAADECLAAMGTDTGGSVRLPASFCNVVGLKPTYGRVSRYGVVAMASSLDCMGHLTKTVEDSALILGVTAGFDPKDATSSNKPVEDYLEGIRGNRGTRRIRIGLPKEYFGEGLDARIKEKILGALGVLEDLGAKIIEVSLPHTKYALAAYYIIQPAEVSSNLARYDGIRFGNDRDKFGDEAKRRIMLGTYILSAGYYDAYYLKAMKVRTLIKRDFNEVFKKVDVLISPVSPNPPFKLGEKVNDPMQMYLADIYTVTANLAGIPGLSIPAGFVDGLPVGMQILGPQFSEKMLFQVGKIYEQSTH
ncbi:Asp-tRNA(Asn)/Glu-tRNA(Gln) amidotransferase GatCAB subunit A [Candidatus Shapirobacteria bacterium CG10_big_fil_rev_8_21_14_0_10_38_8]|nr:MAG: Asp-tRNA(Asn)/Glu-tRNA(Gln) amidotransferase GatCAB subunit A [Candidatus Shapirobacteria bacterium CG10_big_fil_rev_8_21_14_0_10_38_8]